MLQRRHQNLANLHAASCGVSEHSDEDLRQGVTPECLNRGSTSGLAWIPDTNIRE
jgi:hypothetical protein